MSKRLNNRIFINILTLFVFTFMAGTVLAQESDPPPASPQTLLSGSPSLGGVADVGIGVTSAFGSALPMVSVGGSIVIDRRWLVGASWQGSLGEQEPEGELDEQLYYDLRLVGARLTHLWMPQRLTPVGLTLAGGWGEVEADLRDRFDPDDDSDGPSFGEDNFGWIEPSVAVHLRLVEHLHLRLEAGYRVALGVDYRAASSSDTSGAFIRLSAIGGYFGRREAASSER